MSKPVKVVYPTQHRDGAPDPPTHTRGADFTLPTLVVRGEPSAAQYDAALAAWPAGLPLPSMNELCAIIRAVNAAAWPDEVRTR